MLLPLQAAKPQAKRQLQTKSQLKLMYKHIMDDSKTKRIFIFLCINFSFMFVELIVGFLTNSLGLISDAGHMMFDCTALAIGLYASYIAKFQANDVYTYGFVLILIYCCFDLFTYFSIKILYFILVYLIN